ncbi:hypothetical protein U1872_06355 [Sphingomonas sp. RB3P16]|uniref:hypothetical protein n=1 Tax=Parasphingomonas frigoris TaxID=3096163 RepID=UPI002FCB3D98
MIAATALLLAGCATKPATHPAVAAPIVRTVTVKVPTFRACVPATLTAAPSYPDTDAALSAAVDAASRYLLLTAGRPLRAARLAELEIAVDGCRK